MAAYGTTIPKRNSRSAPPIPTYATRSRTTTATKAYSAFIYQRLPRVRTYQASSQMDSFSSADAAAPAFLLCESSTIFFLISLFLIA